MEKTIFKIGDKVKLLRDLQSSTIEIPKGTIGTVLEAYTSSITVEFKGTTWFLGKDVVDLVSNPNSHYDTRIQPIETMQANMTPEEFQGYCKGNIIKYACRCGRKDDPLKEALKIVDYANWLVLSLQGKIINPHKEEEVKE